MKQQLYYPSTIGEQIRWLIHFQAEFPAVAARLALSPQVIADTLRDVEWVIYGLRGLRAPLEHLMKAVTAFNKTLQSGEGTDAVLPPPLIFPEPPASPPPPPGALKRLFNLVQIIKRHPEYDATLGRLLGIEGNLFAEADSPYPTFSLKLVAGDTHAVVEGRFRRYGRPGVWVECRRDGEDWLPVENGHQAGVFCRATFRDDRPLLDPARPEYRHYRLRFWDGKPFGEWSPVATIVLGNS